MNILKPLEAEISRRGFLKATGSVGASVALYGCSKDGGSGDPDKPDLTADEYF